ncbi:hypothetical protein MG293_013356 [Ovis ammon polii]|uniref:Uncharacterized protein n=1 Tax=Ovis ammon polii TaxID=230172 RepID=A0AAD4TYW7_OVIAM|nr:hypothetical protein MG293_013356 [Ovis ammon polii]
MLARLRRWLCDGLALVDAHRAARLRRDDRVLQASLPPQASPWVVPPSRPYIGAVAGSAASSPGLAQQLLGPAQLHHFLVGQIAEGLTLLLRLCSLVDSYRGKTCF